MQDSASSSYSSFSAEETIAIASQLAKHLTKGDIITLHGPLGAGKTTFAKGIISALCNISLHEVSSPTFTYMNIYTGENPLHHFDLYRITNEDQFFQLGLCEYLDQNAICLVEWPEKISNYLKKTTTQVTLSYRDANERLIEITRETNEKN